jgi:CHASE3 domain sensor protein
MKLSTQILLAFSVIILLSLADSYTNYTLSQKVEHNLKFLQRSEDIIRNSNRTHKAIIDMQSSFRGYLLTDDTTFLDPYHSGLRSVPDYINAQKRLIENNQKQHAILDSIVIIHNEWLKYSKDLIVTRREQPDSYTKLFETTLKQQVGKRLNDSIARKFLRFDRIEYATRKYYNDTLLSAISNTHTISLIFLILTVIVGVISTVYIIMLITKRIASMVRLAENISSGQFTVVNDTKNDELTGLSRSLNVMSSKLNKNIRELEHRNAELNKFAYVVSHDLKAPIRGIHNVIKWIEEDFTHELSPELKKYLTIIPQRNHAHGSTY